MSTYVEFKVANPDMSVSKSGKFFGINERGFINIYCSSGEYSEFDYPFNDVPVDIIVKANEMNNHNAWFRKQCLRFHDISRRYMIGDVVNYLNVPHQITTDFQKPSIILKNMSDDTFVKVVKRDVVYSILQNEEI